MIYLDNASTTAINDEVNNLIFDINQSSFFNPSALYTQSLDLHNKIEEYKSKLSYCLGIEPNHLIITSGATESNNLAILGLKTGKKNAEYIFTKGEHPSVYNVANNLKNSGAIVKFVSLTNDGTVNQEELKSMLNENTHFVSIIHVNNETGAINDIKNLVSIVKSYNNKILFHSDGVQAFGKIEVNLKELNVDAYTISAHKFHGPKGVGALYIKNLNMLKPIIYGGGQQQGLRSGTENVSGTLAMCLAGEIATNSIKENLQKVSLFRKIFLNALNDDKSIDYIINQSKNNSPYILSLSFKNLRGEVIMHLLEQQGVLVGIGSACSSKKSENRILSAMGQKKEYILGNIRISFSAHLTLEEVEYASKTLVSVVKNLKEKIT